MGDYRFRNKALDRYEQDVASLSLEAREQRRRRLRELATPEAETRAADSADHRESLRQLRIALDED